MATLIYANGTELPVDGPITLELMYEKLLCDMVECVHLPDGKTLWVDEMGKYKNLEVNEKATKLLHEAGGIPWDRVVGAALVCKEGEVR